MTTYRRRLASSVAVPRITLARHRAAAVESGEAATPELRADDEAGQEMLDTDELAELEREALATEKRADIARCPPDSKLAHLRDTWHHAVYVSWLSYADSWWTDALGVLPTSRRSRTVCC